LYKDDRRVYLIIGEIGVGHNNSIYLDSVIQKVVNIYGLIKLIATIADKNAIEKW